jgi:hypothetical protein
MRYPRPELPGSGPMAPPEREPDAPPPDPGEPPDPEPIPMPDLGEPVPPRPGDPVPRWTVHNRRFGALNTRRCRQPRAR